MGSLGFINCYGIKASNFLPISKFAGEASIDEEKKGIQDSLFSLQNTLLLKEEFASSAEGKAAFKALHDELGKNIKLIDNNVADKTEAYAFANDLIKFVRDEVVALVDDMDKLLASPFDFSILGAAKDTELSSLSLVDESDKPESSDILKRCADVEKKRQELMSRCPEAPSGWKNNLSKLGLATLTSLCILIISKVVAIFFKIGILFLLMNVDYQVSEAAQGYKASNFKPSKTFLESVGVNLESLKQAVSVQRQGESETSIGVLEVKSEENAEGIRALQQVDEEKDRIIQTLKVKLQKNEEKIGIVQSELLEIKENYLLLHNEALQMGSILRVLLAAMPNKEDILSQVDRGSTKNGDLELKVNSLSSGLMKNDINGTSSDFTELFTILSPPYQNVS